MLVQIAMIAASMQSVFIPASSQTMFSAPPRVVSAPPSLRLGPSGADTLKEAPAATPADTLRTRRRGKAFEYASGYNTRLQIHKYGSYAMVPLFAAEYVLGQKLYNGTGGSGTKSAHGAVAAGLGVVFGVNTITGIWNLAQGWHDPASSTKRKVHSLLMLVADAGFVWAASAAKGGERDRGTGVLLSAAERNHTHKAVALASISLSVVGSAMMWFFK